MEIISAFWYVDWSTFTDSDLVVVLGITSTVSVWLVTVNPAITIIAIAAATPLNIAIFLLDEKLDAESLFELELVVGFACDFILVADCLGEEALSRGWFFRCVVINDST